MKVYSEKSLKEVSEQVTPLEELGQAVTDLTIESLKKDKEIEELKERINALEGEG